MRGFRKAGGITDLINSKGKVIASGTHVIFAAGAGVRDLPMFEDFELRYSRGETSWAKTAGQEGALTYGG